MAGVAITGFFVYLHSMDKSTKRLLTITGGVLITAYFAKKLMDKGQAIKNLNVNVSKVDFNTKDKTFVVFVRLINPSNASITVQSIVGDVFWNGTTAATLDFRNKTVIGINEEKSIQIPIKMNLTLISLVTDLLTKKIKDVIQGVFEIKGVVNAEGLIVPFEYKNDIKFGA